MSSESNTDIVEVTSKSTLENDEKKRYDDSMILLVPDEYVIGDIIIFPKAGFAMLF